MKCLNWKVIAGLAAIGIGLYALTRGLAMAAGPLLILAVCPLSMAFMMRAMGSMGSCKTKDDGETNPDEVAQLLLGEADFYSLSAAHGNVYGYDSTGGRFMVSPDGKQWETRSRLGMGDWRCW